MHLARILYTCSIIVRTVADRHPPNAHTCEYPGHVRSRTSGFTADRRPLRMHPPLAERRGVPSRSKHLQTKTKRSRGHARTKNAHIAGRLLLSYIIFVVIPVHNASRESSLYKNLPQEGKKGRTPPGDCCLPDSRPSVRGIVYGQVQCDTHVEVFVLL